MTDLTIVRRVHWQRRMAAALLVLAALAAGLWWNATRLNATEWKLVGVWLDSDGDATLLMPDRRAISLTQSTGGWIHSPGSLQFSNRWRATSDTVTYQFPPRVELDWPLTAWLAYGKRWWNDEFSSARKIVRMTDQEIETLNHERGDTITLRRSTDPELLRIFERLNTGETL